MLSRRRFLHTAAVASAAPLIWSRTSVAAPSDKLNLAFIGVGTMGRGHLNGFLGRQNVEVVAVCDVEKERLESAANTVTKRYADRTKAGTYAGVKSFGDFRDLLSGRIVAGGETPLAEILTDLPVALLVPEPR